MVEHNRISVERVVAVFMVMKMVVLCGPKGEEDGIGFYVHNQTDSDNFVQYEMIIIFRRKGGIQVEERERGGV